MIYLVGAILGPLSLYALAWLIEKCSEIKGLYKQNPSLIEEKSNLIRQHEYEMKEQKERILNRTFARPYEDFIFKEFRSFKKRDALTHRYELDYHAYVDYNIFIQDLQDEFIDADTEILFEELKNHNIINHSPGTVVSLGGTLTYDAHIVSEKDQDFHDWYLKYPDNNPDFVYHDLPFGNYVEKEQVNWEIKSSRDFTEEELAAVDHATIVSSNFGNSVCFHMKGGGMSFIPMMPDSKHNVGEEVDLKDAKILTLGKTGEKDISRILYYKK